MKKHIQNGFAHQGIFLLLLVAAVIGLVGYKVAKTDKTSTSASQTTAGAPRTIPTINNNTDLQQAETQVSGSNVDGDLNPDSLNDDVSSLL